MVSLLVSPDQRPADVKCTDEDRLNAVLYEHGVITQATAEIGPQGTVLRLLTTRESDLI